MDDLIAFLNARLDDDERYARVMQAAGQRLKDSPSPGMEAFVASTLAAMLGDDEAMREVAHWKHLLPPNDLDRVLREVKAKRAIVERYAKAPDWAGGEDVRLLATVWSDHPDYRQEWTP